MPDPFPRLHPRPSTGWVNDPNGVGFWDDRYHVMFQWNPFGPQHHAIHWGHLSSPDLVHWREEGIALAPRPGGIDETGAWSGVAVVDEDGEPRLVYTAVRTGAMDSGVAVAARAGGRFVAGGDWVAPHPEGFLDVRDPFRVEGAGRELWVQGAGTLSGTGAVLAYEVSEDGGWRLLGPLLGVDDVPDGLLRQGSIWECPQLFRLGEDWVLLVSWVHRSESGESLGVTAYVGDLDLAGDAPRFRVRAANRLDGPEFYAPQGFCAPDGRVLLFSWTWEGRGTGVLGRAQVDTDAAGWAGSLTFARELQVQDGRAVCRPAAELLALRAGPLAHDEREVATAEAAWEVLAAGPVVLQVHDDDGAHEVWSGESPTVRVLVDASVVEVFTAEDSSTLRIYPRGEARWVLRAGHVDAAHRLA
ncbi:glycoside hydrolase family 32 protein [Kineococcus gynurae]|uniref:beta-fructofuranosidase n=1 Tax=Kineococcus gynurae TaxID=452979 RepID=A0ABV5LVA7_9ACTN